MTVRMLSFAFRFLPRPPCRSNCAIVMALPLHSGQLQEIKRVERVKVPALRLVPYPQYTCTCRRAQCN